MSETLKPISQTCVTCHLAKRCASVNLGGGTSTSPDPAPLMLFCFWFVVVMLLFVFFNPPEGGKEPAAFSPHYLLILTGRSRVQSRFSPAGHTPSHREPRPRALGGQCPGLSSPPWPAYGP